VTFSIEVRGLYHGYMHLPEFSLATDVAMVHSRLNMKWNRIRPLAQARPLWLVAVSVFAAGVINALLVVVNTRLFLPLFFDSIFTACVAALFGWLPGLLVGLWTNVAAEMMFGFPMTMLPFAICNMSTGLIVGLMAERGSFRSSIHALIAVVLVTASNSLLGSLIATYMYGGITGSAAVDYVVVGLLATGRTVLSAAFLARIPANLVDKGIAVFAAFFLLGYLSHKAGWPRGERAGTKTV
jgi:energy-coupling factor transport system substrate-specific component